MTISLLLLVAAFVACIASWGWSKPSLHLAVILIIVFELLHVLPR